MYILAYVHEPRSAARKSCEVLCPASRCRAQCRLVNLSGNALEFIEIELKWLIADPTDQSSDHRRLHMAGDRFRQIMLFELGHVLCGQADLQCLDRILKLLRLRNAHDGRGNGWTGCDPSIGNLRHRLPHDDHVVLFYDRSDKAEIIDEADILDGKVEKRIVDTVKPHHGVAVTMGRYVLVSVPNTEIETKPDELPPRIGLRVVDEKGEQVGETATCTDLHGEATSARLVAFGCKEGVLVVRPGGLDGPKLTMLPYPADFAKAHTGTLLGGKAMQFFLGNYGDDKLVLIDADAEQPYKLIELPTRRVDFQLDPAEPRNAYILTEDGDLHVLNVVKGEIVNKVKVTEPYSKDGHWRDPRPRLAVADGQIAITDPRHSLVRVVDAETLRETRTIAVEGQPFSIVAVGGSGAPH